MTVRACIPVIPSANLEKSLRFWVEGIGLTMDREMRYDGRLIGCMVYNEHTCFWLNKREGTTVKPEDYEGIRLAFNEEHYLPYQTSVHVTRR
ncbi:MAG TPA: hypothetical protein VM802_30610 [Chitinophaga sp.]|uniref:hypothetical protein n=1 Tax=Chitinophaga sp. TaxID=1869181 RepID=UPI002CC3C70B|nr:hypothetical protein [Chitinophaga sp.]HVI49257.1 hypothetical protein [Chitinophaga sp.]